MNTLKSLVAAVVGFLTAVPLALSSLSSATAVSTFEDRAKSLVKDIQDEAVKAYAKRDTLVAASNAMISRATNHHLAGDVLNRLAKSLSPAPTNPAPASAPSAAPAAAVPTNTTAPASAG